MSGSWLELETHKPHWIRMSVAKEELRVEIGMATDAERRDKAAEGIEALDSQACCTIGRLRASDALYVDRNAQKIYRMALGLV